MNAEKQKKLTCFLKKLQLSNFKEKKHMTEKLFEFQERFMIGTLIKFIQFKKTGVLGKFLLHWKI